jgi:hypothetical protein
MPRVPSTRNYPPKLNNNASDGSTEFSKQDNDRTTKGFPSSGRCLGNTRVHRREFVFFLKIGGCNRSNSRRELTN